MAKKKTSKKKPFRKKSSEGKQVSQSKRRQPSVRGKTNTRGKVSARGASSGPLRAEEQRLQRALATAGLGSRRDCETLIEEGRVEVDGKVVMKLGSKVNPRKQKIRVDGSLVKFARPQYFVLNKPPGVVSTSNDPSGRMRVIDLIKTTQRVYNVGRLDKSSEGLILVTNDGDLANQLTHPRYGVQKIYMVQVAGTPDVSELKKLEQGVYLAEGLAKVVGAKIKKRTKESTWLEITLEEGRNREIRRLLANIGHKVLRLRRVAIGSLRLGELPLGAHRKLEKKEIEELWYSSSRQKSASKKPRHRKSSSSSKTSKAESKNRPVKKRNDDPDRKKPFKKRGEESSDRKKSFKKRGEESSDRKKPFKKRGEESSERKKPFKKRREESSDRKKPFKKRGEESSDRKKSFKKRGEESSDRKKPFKKRGEESSERKKPFKKRGDESSDRKKPFKKRGDEDFDRKGTFKKKSGRRSETEGSDRPTRRKPKPKVGEKGWTLKSGGKRRKKKSTSVTRTAPARSAKRSAGKSKRRK